MAGHNTLTGAELHEPKDIATATVGQVYIANGAGSGSFSIPGGNNTVVVNTLADLPTPSGGTHTLLADTTYIIAGAVDTGSNFITVANNSKVTANNLFAPQLKYSGTGSMFVGVDANFSIDDIELNCPTAQVFDMSEAGAGGAKTFQCDSVRVVNTTKWGTFNKLLGVLNINSSSTNCDDGITLQGNVTIITSVRQLAMIGTSTTFIGIDFGTSVQQTVELTDLVLVGGAGSIGIKGAAASANITANFIATVAIGSFDGVTTPLSGITVDDIRWKFAGNGNIPDTQADAMVSLNTNTTATVIAAVNTPVLVAGTWVDERSSHYTNTTAGRSTYDGERDLTTPIDAVLVVEPASGTNKSIRAYVALNGTVIVNSGKTILVDSGDPKEITLLWQRKLSTTDFLELFVENKTDAIDITVKDAILRVR